MPMVTSFEKTFHAVLFYGYNLSSKMQIIVWLFLIFLVCFVWEEGTLLIVLAKGHCLNYWPLLITFRNLPISDGWEKFGLPDRRDCLGLYVYNVFDERFHQLLKSSEGGKNGKYFFEERSAVNVDSKFCCYTILLHIFCNSWHFIFSTANQTRDFPLFLFCLWPLCNDQNANVLHIVYMVVS